MASKKTPKTSKSKADSKAKTPGKRGGARPGAGRPTKETTKLKAELNRQCVDFVEGLMPDLLKNQWRLAKGGYDRVTQIKGPAGLQTYKVPLTLPDKDGKLATVYNPFTNAPVMIDVPMYPHLDPGELVVVEVRSEKADGDRAANEYLINRGAGKPTESIELTGKDGEPLPANVVVAIDKVYGAAPSEPEGDR